MQHRRREHPDEPQRLARDDPEAIELVAERDVDELDDPGQREGDEQHERVSAKRTTKLGVHVGGGLRLGHGASVPMDRGPSLFR